MKLYFLINLNARNSAIAHVAAFMIDVSTWNSDNRFNCNSHRSIHGMS